MEITERKKPRESIKKNKAKSVKKKKKGEQSQLRKAST